MLSQTSSVFITIYFNLLVVRETCSTMLPDIPCGVHTSYVKTDRRKNRYIPQVVKLQRCVGSVMVANMKCGRKSYETLDVKVFDLFQMTMASIKLKNHTSCQYVCRKGPESCSKYQIWRPHLCSCECQTPFHLPCTQKQIWDIGQCACRCNTHMSKHCGKIKKWDESSCACVCKETKEISCCKGTVDKDTCKCIHTVVTKQQIPNSGDFGVSFVVYGISLVVEGLCLLLLFILTFRWTQRKIAYQENSYNERTRLLLSKE